METELAALLDGANARFHTLFLDALVETDGALLGRALERSIPDFEQGVAEGWAVRMSAVADGRNAGGVFRHGWRVWWRKPHDWRDDIVWEGGATAVSIVRATSASSFVSSQRTLYTNAAPPGATARPGAWQLPTLASQLSMIPLLEPSAFASGWEIGAPRVATFGGRAVLASTARWPGGGVAPGPWQGVDRYDLLVDVERGVLLRCAGIVDGVEAGVFTARAVVFDEPVGEEVFAWRPSEGTRIVAV